MIGSLPLLFAIVLEAASSGAAGPRCGLLPCDIRVKRLGQYPLDGGSAEAIRALSPIKLPRAWRSIGSTGKIRTLSAGHDYLIFTERGGASVYDLGSSKPLEWLDVQAGSRRRLNHDRLGGCWPQVPYTQVVLFLSSEDAGQIFYRAGRWRMIQCGD